MAAKLYPSSFPMWLECPCYDSSPFPSDAATAGSEQHELLNAMLAGEQVATTKGALMAKMDESGLDAVTWAFEAILDLMKERGVRPADAKRELLVAICDQNLEQITRGRIDLGFGRCILDYKSGEIGNYVAQMDGYAAGWAQTYNLFDVEVIEVYGRYRRMKTRIISRVDAEDTVFRVRAARENPNRQPKACRYCGWCAHNLECKELLVPATLVHDGLPEKYTKDPGAVAELLKTDIADATPEQLSLMKRLSDIVGPWSKAVDDRVRNELAGGADIPGYVQNRRKGNRFITDTLAAAERCGLDVKAFLGCCSASLPKLEKMLAEVEGMKKAEAGRELGKRLGPLVGRGRDRIYVERAKAFLEGK